MRWLVRLIGVSVIVVAVAIGSLMMLPGDRIAKIAAEQITRVTGRTVTMSGETRISLYPVLGVSTGRVDVANADWSGAGPMLRAEALKIGVEPTALFGGDIRITGLEIVNPKIVLERATDGRVNWQLGLDGVASSGQSEGGTPAQSRALALTLDRALISGAGLRYVDHEAGIDMVMEGMDFDLRWPDPQGAATFDAVLRPSGKPVEIFGKIERFQQFVDGNVTDVNGTVVAPGGALRFAGEAGKQPQLGGRLSVDLTDTMRFLDAFGLTGTELPEGLGRTISGQTDVTLTQDMRMALRDATIMLDSNRLRGAADIFAGGGKPSFNIQVTAEALDLSGLTGTPGGEAAAQGGGAGDNWSTEPLDAGALGIADGALALLADSVDLGSLKLGRTRIMMTLERSRAVFDLRELRAYDGSVNGELVANNRNGLSVGGRVFVKDINMESLLADSMGFTRLAAKGSGELRFLGVGQSVQAIMSSLNGEGRLSAGRGVISGIDLDRLMRTGEATGGTTVFDRLTASFSMKNGTLNNDDLLLELPLVKARGEGRVGLGERDIDYRFTPTLMEGDTRRGLAIPVRIRGPWDNPRILPDLERAISLNFGKEKEKVEKKAREKINRALERELGVTVGEGQSVEDALKEKLETEATRGLMKLLE